MALWERLAPFPTAPDSSQPLARAICERLEPGWLAGWLAGAGAFLHSEAQRAHGRDRGCCPPEPCP